MVHSSPGSARRFVADALVRWGYTGTLLDNARLLITELATNPAVQYLPIDGRGRAAYPPIDRFVP